MLLHALMAALSFFGALLGTALVRRIVLRHGIVDVPTPRSSHSMPVPRGGGVAVVTTVLALIVALGGLGFLSLEYMVPLTVGGLAVAGVGFMDDCRGLSPVPRLVVHGGAALLVVAHFGDLPPQPVGGLELDLAWLAPIFCLAGIVWMLNLFNFMDGIDGIAAAEAIFICASSALLITISGNESQFGMVLLVMASANLGFVFWNWAPAKIFMGDTGSGFIGYLIAIVAVMTVEDGILTVWTWLILSSLFIADATVTLLRRMWRGERWFAAHRTHAYQWLSRRWKSHAKVTSAYSLVNLIIILPIAVAAVRDPRIAAPLALASLAAAVGAAAYLGAGRSERPELRVR